MKKVKRDFVTTLRGRMGSSKQARRAGALGASVGRTVEPGPNWGRRGELGRVPCLVLCLVLALCSVQPTAGYDKLQVQMAGKSQSVVLDKMATISCKIIKDPDSPNLDISIMGVTWSLKKEDKKIKVFEFFGDYQKAYRPGAHISLENLKRGDASLMLPKVQLMDAGEYLCEVVVTPRKAQGSIPVVVIAEPFSNLYLEQNKSILCTASRFFPENISLHWKKKTMKDFQFQEFFANVTGDPIIRNQDGTFNVSRSLNLKPSLADNLTVFQCVIEHLPSDTIQALNLTLIIPEPENTATFTWIYYCLPVLIVPVFVGCLFPLCKRCRKHDRTYREICNLEDRCFCQPGSKGVCSDVLTPCSLCLSPSPDYSENMFSPD